MIPEEVVESVAKALSAARDKEDTREILHALKGDLSNKVGSCVDAIQEGGSMKAMGKVLAEHQQWVSGSCGLEDECICGHELRHASIASHQADMLSMAGYGPVRETANRVGKRYARLHQMLRDELQAQARAEATRKERK